MLVTILQILAGAVVGSLVVLYGSRRFIVAFFVALLGLYLISNAA